MKGSGVILLILALIAIYLGVSGKYCCIVQFLKCAVSDSLSPCECGEKQNTIGAVPSVPSLPKLPALMSLSTLG